MLEAVVEPPAARVLFVSTSTKPVLSAGKLPSALERTEKIISPIH